MMDWFESRNLREKAIVVALAAVLLIVFIDTLLVTPYLEHRQQLAQKLEQAREDLAWMQRAVGRLGSAQTPRQAGIQGNIATYIDTQFSRAGLKQQLQQMTPIERKSVRVRLSDVPFRSLARFFSGLNPQVVVDEIRILPTGETGMVDVNMVLTNLEA